MVRVNREVTERLKLAILPERLNCNRRRRAISARPCGGTAIRSGLVRDAALSEQSDLFAAQGNYDLFGAAANDYAAIFDSFDRDLKDLGADL